LTRRIIGLSMLNTLRIGLLNHLTIMQFNVPDVVRNGPLGDTVTDSYSFRLNTSFAPRSDYLKDIAALPPFLLIAGAEDEAFYAKEYEPVMQPANSQGQYAILPGVNHLGVMDAPATAERMGAFLNEL
jgi:acetyl esterase/lipase